MNPACLVESVLFASGEPLRLSELAQVTGLSLKEITEAVGELTKVSENRGIRVVHDDGLVQLVTAPEAAEAVACLHQRELRGGLSAAALETLAIIAYRGPVTRPVIEAIRGVQSSAPLRTLAIRGLTAEVGRADEVGRPILYATTLELLKELGISSRAELPLLSAEQEVRLREVAERTPV